MNVWIVTEGNKTIGFGHITRCLGLSNAFETRGIEPKLIINRNNDWLKKRDKILHLINKADVVVVDSYLADFNFYSEIVKKSKIPVFIDDDNRLDYPGGIILNGSVYAEKLNYPKNEKIDYLLGSKFIPLRKEFWTNSSKKINKQLNTIMITFGGEDIRNMTGKIIRIIKKEFPKISVKIAGGNLTAQKMKFLMLHSDLAISASGQTLYELAHIGIPTIAVGVAENQKNNIMGMLKAGFIDFAGWWSDRNLAKKISGLIRKYDDIDYRKKISRLGKKLIDGKGALRIVDFIFKKTRESNLSHQ